MILSILITHNLKQNNQTIKILRDDGLIGGFEATTAFERGRAEEEEERGGWECTEEARDELKWAGANEEWKRRNGCSAYSRTRKQNTEMKGNLFWL